MKTTRTSYNVPSLGTKLTLLHECLAEGYANPKDVADAYRQFDDFVVDQTNPELYKSWMLYAPTNLAKAWEHMHEQTRLVVVILSLNAHYYRGRTD